MKYTFVQGKVRKPRAAQIKCYPHIVLCEDSPVTSERTNILMRCRFVGFSVDLWYKVAHYWPPVLNIEKTIKKKLVSTKKFY